MGYTINSSVHGGLSGPSDVCLGASFDPSKAPGYKEEVRRRLNLAHSFNDFVAAVGKTSQNG